MLSQIDKTVNNYFASVAKMRKLAYHANMNKAQAIEKAGTAMALAKLLGIKRQAISQWGEQLPVARYWQLKVLRPEWFTNK